MYFASFTQNECEVFTKEMGENARLDNFLWVLRGEGAVTPLGTINRARGRRERFDAGLRLPTVVSDDDGGDGDATIFSHPCVPVVPANVRGAGSALAIHGRLCSFFFFHLRDPQHGARSATTRG